MRRPARSALVGLLAAALASAAGCKMVVEGGPRVERHGSSVTAGLDLPFASAVRVGHTLYVSGQIGNRPGTLELAPGGIAGEARQALDNLTAVLRESGSSLEQVVKVNVYLEDIGDWPAFNAVYVEYFPGRKPARSALGADGLALGALVELDCVAVVD